MQLNRFNANNARIEDVVYELNRRNMFNNMIIDLYIYQNISYIVLIYTALNTLGFSDFSDVSRLSVYLNSVLVDMVYIKNKKTNISIYTNDLDIYYIKNDTLYLRLKGNRKTQIKLV